MGAMSYLMLILLALTAVLTGRGDGASHHLRVSGDHPAVWAEGLNQNELIPTRSLVSMGFRIHVGDATGRNCVSLFVAWLLRLLVGVFLAPMALLSALSWHADLSKCGYALP